MMMSKLMNYRMFSVGALALALLAVSSSAFAAKKADKATHDGKVVSITDDNLVMASKSGEEHSHTLSADAKLTLDGITCKIADLKPGMRIRVTTLGVDKSVASRIEGIEKNLDFASKFHDGKVVSINGDKLVMTDTQGKEEHTCTLTADVKVTLDGKACKAADLKPGTKVRVSAPDSDKSVANRIEGIDKNPSFASNFHDGKVVSIDSDKLVMTGTQGKEEHICALSDDLEVTCDGRVCKTSDLKQGMRIRVTLDSDDPQTANCIEAIDENPEFARLQKEVR